MSPPVCKSTSVASLVLQLSLDFVMSRSSDRPRLPISVRLIRSRQKNTPARMAAAGASDNGRGEPVPSSGSAASGRAMLPNACRVGTGYFASSARRRCFGRNRTRSSCRVNIRNAWDLMLAFARQIASKRSDT